MLGLLACVLNFLIFSFNSTCIYNYNTIIHFDISSIVVVLKEQLFYDCIEVYYGFLVYIWFLGSIFTALWEVNVGLFMKAPILFSLYIFFLLYKIYEDLVDDFSFSPEEAPDDT